MNLFLLLSLPLVLVFLREFHQALSSKAVLRAILGSTLTTLVLFAVYWPYSSGFQFPWNLFQLGLYQLVMEYLLFPLPVLLIWYFIGRKVSSEGEDLWFLTLWLGTAFTLLGLRDYLFTGASSQDLELFLQPLLRGVILVTLPKGLLALLKQENPLEAWGSVAGIPLLAALLCVLNLWQWGWISYVIAVPLFPAAVWYRWKDSLFKTTEV